MVNKDQAETMVTMLDAGWTLAAIAAHFCVEVRRSSRQSVIKLSQKEIRMRFRAEENKDHLPHQSPASGSVRIPN